MNTLETTEDTFDCGLLSTKKPLERVSYNQKVQENSQEELEILAPDDPMRGVYAVYSWLGWLQESLIQALMDDAL